MPKHIKICSNHKCTETQPKFSKCKSAKDRLQHRCKVCESARLKQVRESNPDYIKAYRNVNKNRLKIYEKNYRQLKMYGITSDQKQSLFEKQQGKCAICLKILNSVDSAHTDHNHLTKTVRGLLCMPCNNALGLLKENLNTLSNMIEYIKNDKALSETQKVSREDYSY